MRAFIAIELPQEIKDYLSCIQKQLSRANADTCPVKGADNFRRYPMASNEVKWVKPENIHLTLKFLDLSLKDRKVYPCGLGERDDKKIEKISVILEETAKNKQVFGADIRSIGAFPKIDSPRVIWAGIGKGDKEIKEIAEELEEKIAKTGIPKEDRTFSSHITIGRTHSNSNLEKLVQELKRLESEIAKQALRQFSINKITLFKSTLTSSGPIYEPLKEVALKK